MSSNYKLNRSRCKGCSSVKAIGPFNYTISMEIMKLTTLNQVITKSISQSGSQYLGNLGSLEVLNWKDASCNQVYQASQVSDRYQKAKVPLTAVIPTRGNSIKRTQTSLRPGALGPGGHGVDIKHNSYARYLAKKKGKAILGKSIPITIKNSKHTVNNKFMKPWVVAGGMNCF